MAFLVLTCYSILFSPLNRNNLTLMIILFTSLIYVTVYQSTELHLFALALVIFVLWTPITNSLINNTQNSPIYQIQKTMKIMNRMAQTLVTAFVNSLPSRILPLILNNEKLPCEIVNNVAFCYLSLLTDDNRLKDINSESARVYLSQINHFYCLLDFLSDVIGIQKIKSCYSYYMCCVGAQAALDQYHGQIKESDFLNIHDQAKLLITFCLASQEVAKMMGLKCSCGITKGNLVVGVLGIAGGNINFDTYGDIVNTAARIAKNAQIGVFCKLDDFKISNHSRGNDLTLINEDKDGFLNEYLNNQSIFNKSRKLILKALPCYYFTEQIVKSYKGKGNMQVFEIKPTSFFKSVLASAFSCGFQNVLQQFISDNQQHNENDTLSYEAIIQQINDDSDTNNNTTYLDSNSTVFGSMISNSQNYEIETEGNASDKSLIDQSSNNDKLLKDISVLVSNQNLVQLVQLFDKQFDQLQCLEENLITPLVDIKQYFDKEFEKQITQQSFPSCPIINSIEKEVCPTDQKNEVEFCGKIEISNLISIIQRNKSSVNSSDTQKRNSNLDCNSLVDQYPKSSTDGDSFSAQTHEYCFARNQPISQNQAVVKQKFVKPPSLDLTKLKQQTDMSSDGIISSITDRKACLDESLQKFFDIAKNTNRSKKETKNSVIKGIPSKKKVYQTIQEDETQEQQYSICTSSKQQRFAQSDSYQSYDSGDQGQKPVRKSTYMANLLEAFNDDVTDSEEISTHKLFEHEEDPTQSTQILSKLNYIQSLEHPAEIDQLNTSNFKQIMNQNLQKQDGYIEEQFMQLINVNQTDNLFKKNVFKVLFKLVWNHLLFFSRISQYTIDRILQDNQFISVLLSVQNDKYFGVEFLIFLVQFLIYGVLDKLSPLSLMEVELFYFTFNLRSSLLMLTLAECCLSLLFNIYKLYWFRNFKQELKLYLKTHWNIEIKRLMKGGVIIVNSIYFTLLLLLHYLSISIVLLGFKSYNENEEFYVDAKKLHIYYMSQIFNTMIIFVFSLHYATTPIVFVSINLQLILAGTFIFICMQVVIDAFQIFIFITLGITALIYVIPSTKIFFTNTITNRIVTNQINQGRLLLKNILPQITIDSLLASSSPEVLKQMISQFSFLQKFEKRIVQLVSYDVLVKSQYGVDYGDKLQQMGQNLPDNGECNEEDQQQFLELKLFHQFRKFLRFQNPKSLGSTRPVINFENVSYLNLDVQNFTLFSSSLSVEQIMNFLQIMFDRFDERIKKSKTLIQVKISGDCYELMSLPVELKSYEDNESRGKYMSAFRQLSEEDQLLLKIYDALVLLIGVGLGFVADCQFTLKKFFPEWQDRVGLRVGIGFGNVIGSLLGQKLCRFDTFGQTTNEAEFVQSNTDRNTVGISEAALSILTRGKRLFQQTLLSFVSDQKAIGQSTVDWQNEYIDFDIKNGNMIIGILQHGK